MYNCTFSSNVRLNKYNNDNNNNSSPGCQKILQNESIRSRVHNALLIYNRLRSHSKRNQIHVLEIEIDRNRWRRRSDRIDRDEEGFGRLGRLHKIFYNEIIRLSYYMRYRVHGSKAIDLYCNRIGHGDRSSNNNNSSVRARYVLCRREQTIWFRPVDDDKHSVQRPRSHNHV
jgi:hypothetical protein